MYYLNKIKTKIIIQKLIERLEREYSSEDDSVLANILSAYDAKRSEIFGEANIDDSDKNIQINKWTNYNLETLPKSYERYLVLSSLIRGRYSDIAKLDSDILNENSSIETHFSKTKLSLIRKDGEEENVLIRMPILKANNKKNPRFYINHEMLNYLDDYRFEKHNTALIDSVTARDDLNLTKEQVILILKAMSRVVIAINKQRYPPALEDLKTFEYFTKIPIEKLYKPKFIDIKIRLKETNMEVKKNMINTYNMSENKKFVLDSIIRELSCRIIKIGTKIIQTFRDDKYGMIIFDEKDNVFFTDCDYDFIVDSNNKIILGYKAFLKELNVDELGTECRFKLKTNECNFMSCGNAQYSLVFLKDLDKLAQVLSIANLRKGSCIVIPDNDEYFNIIYFEGIENNAHLVTASAGEIREDGFQDLIAYTDDDQVSYGIINDEICIPPVYEEKIVVKGEFFTVLKGGFYGVIDRTGNIRIPFEYQKIGMFSEGLIAAEKENKFGFIDINGETIIPFIYDAAYDFSEDMATVRKQGKECIINKKGEELFETDYDAIFKFSEGYAAFRIISSRDKDEYKYGYIDSSGKVIVEPIYDEVSSIKNGKAQVVSNNMISMISLLK